MVVLLVAVPHLPRMAIRQKQNYLTRVVVGENKMRRKAKEAEPLETWGRGPAKGDVEDAWLNLWRMTPLCLIQKVTKDSIHDVG